MSTFSPKTPVVNLIEIAQQCNVSVRDIHAKAKEIGHELKPNAREVENKVAKAIIAAFLGREPKKADSEPKAPKVPPKIKKTTKVIKPKPVKIEQKSKEPIFTASQKSPEPKIESKAIVKPKSRVIFKDEILEETESVPKPKIIKIQEKPKKTKPPKVSAPKPKVQIDTTIADELLGLNEDDGTPKDAAEIYDELIEQERQKEIVQSQRKKSCWKRSWQGISEEN